MSVAMAEDISRSVVTNSSQVDKEIADEKYRELRRPRKLRFFVNGDRYFRGKKVYITPNRYYSFNELLNDLTGKLPSNASLPYGVRQIFTPVSGRRISDIGGLADGETYVCAGFEGFKMIKYGRADLEPWSLARPQPNPNAEQENDYPGSYRYRGYVSNAFHPGRYFRTNHSYSQRRWPGTFGNSHRASNVLQSESKPQKPKLVTIVKSGPKPRSNIKILLNRKSVQSYEQLMSDIAEALSRGVNTAKGQRLFAVSGKEVQGVSDFFRSDNLFIALGTGEAELTSAELSDILGELFPEDAADTKTLVKEWERYQRKNKRTLNSVDAAVKSIHKETNVVKNVQNGEIVETHVPDKRDSGFDSSDTSANKSEPDQTMALVDRKAVHRPRRKMAKESEKDDNGVEPVPNPHQSYHMIRKMEKERMRKLNEERERATRRHQKMLEAERRVKEEERRKRGLIPVKGSDSQFNKAEDVRLEEVDEAQRKKEAERRKAEEEKLELLRKQRGEREAAEKAARERMARAEKEEKEKREKERLEKEHKEKIDKDNREKDLVEKERKRLEQIERDSHKSDPAAVTESKIHDSETSTGGQTIPAEPADEVKTEEQMVVTDSAVANDKRRTEAAAGNEEIDVKDSNNNNNVRQQKEKRKQEKDEKQQRKRAKTKIVRKTKEERQVGSDEFILQRYDLGAKLGDGNFAIVRKSRNKESGQEVAVKVIDKAKLKGKEQMVENEIDIMKDCSHHNIVRLYEEYETAERIYLVMELVKGGDLFDAITQSVKFGEMESALMVKDLCHALFYLHSRHIVHRDLKPENLLVHRNKDGSITLKLADFGLAMEVKELIYTVCGTPTYVAPEILTEIGYGLEVDMWAVGVITYILLCGFPPFRSPDRNQTELFEFIKAGDYQFLSPYWDNTSRSAKDLISRLLIVDRKKRYTSIDVLCHRWIVCNGQPDIIPNGAQSVDIACKETRLELEVQSKAHFETFQRLKEKKKRDREKVEE
ncbi:unnamed protein product [Lymnaea stagnalis]|uniref:non-specific serine/threonine protein kinase n=1 Tax=Lymnaea stagnalis TaxID=6523 RepID=A0AAV2I243_LYMST